MNHLWSPTTLRPTNKRRTVEPLGRLLAKKHAENSSSRHELIAVWLLPVRSPSCMKWWPNKHKDNDSRTATHEYAPPPDQRHLTPTCPQPHTSRREQESRHTSESSSLIQQKPGLKLALPSVAYTSRLRRPSRHKSSTSV